MRIFFREMGSSRAILSFLFGRNSSSMLRKRCRVICRLSFAPHWVIPMKSSRYTSTCARAVARVCGDSASQSLSANSVVATSSSVVSGGFVFARFSRWWAGAVWRVERVSRARSLTVLVLARKRRWILLIPWVLRGGIRQAGPLLVTLLGRGMLLTGCPLVVPICAYKHWLGLLCLGMWGLTPGVLLVCNL